METIGFFCHLVHVLIIDEQEKDSEKDWEKTDGGVIPRERVKGIERARDRVRYRERNRQSKKYWPWRKAVQKDLALFFSGGEVMQSLFQSAVTASFGKQDTHLVHKKNHVSALLP